MVVPVDPEEDEGQDIGQEHRRKRRQARALLLRHLELEDHDGDEDRDHAIAERLEPSLGHGVPPVARRGLPGARRDARPELVEGTGGAITAW
jgi:hypothetical protein